MDFIFKNIYKYRTAIKFVISGSTSAGVDLLSLFILHGLLKMHVVIAASISFVLAFAVSFIFHKFWTFRNEDRKKAHLQAIVYFSVATVNLALNAQFIYFLVKKVGIFYLYAQMLSGATLSIITFLTLKLVVFKNDKDRETCEEELSGRVLIITGPSIEKAHGIARELEADHKKSDILLYGAEACRAGCPPQKLFYWFRFFYKLYRMTSCHKHVYCLDLKMTGLALAIVKSMREEIKITCPQDELAKLNKENFAEKFVLSKII